MKYRLEALKLSAPMPWYLDQNNANGVCVKDSTGETLFYDDFGSIPDEMPTYAADAIRTRSLALALFLIETSEKEQHDIEALEQIGRAIRGAPSP